MASNGDMFKGFLLGGLIGMAVGVLFAPKSGKDLREDLMDESDDLIGKAKIDRGKNVFEQAGSSEEQDFEDELNSMDEEEAEKKTEKKKSSTRKTAAKKDNA